MKTKLKLIEEKAYYKWLDAGKPEGKDVDFWVEAENEIASIPENIVVDTTTVPNHIDIDFEVAPYPTSGMPMVDWVRLYQSPTIQMPGWNEQQLSDPFYAEQTTL